MGGNTYNIIKNAVLDWYAKLNFKGVQSKKVNKKDALVVDFEFKDCMAQLSVTDSDFRPYRFVYFEAMDINMDYLKYDCCKPIYSAYDTDAMIVDDVIDMLDKAVMFCIKYKPQTDTAQ